MGCCRGLVDWSRSSPWLTAKVKGGANSNTDRVLVIEAPGRPPGGVVPHVNDHVIDERRAGCGVAEGDGAGSGGGEVQGVVGLG